MSHQISPNLPVWIHQHKSAIHHAAKMFLAYAAQPPYLEACWDLDPSGDSRLAWNCDDAGKEIVIGCALAFQTCGRSLESGLLNILVLQATHFEASLEVHPIVNSLSKEGFLCLARPRNCENHEADRPLEILLPRLVFEILSGLHFSAYEPEEEPAPKINLKKTATPILLLEVARLFGRTVRSAAWGDGQKRKKGLTKYDVDFIDASLEVLKKRLNGNRSPELLASEPDNLSVLMLAILFERKATARYVSVEDLMVVALGDLSKQLDVIRKLRSELVRWGMVESVRGDQWQLNSDIFDQILDLDDGDQDRRDDQIPNLTRIENRIKPAQPARPEPPKRKNDEEEGSEGEFDWAAN